MTDIQYKNLLGFPLKTTHFSAIFTELGKMGKLLVPGLYLFYRKIRLVENNCFL